MSQRVIGSKLVALQRPEPVEGGQWLTAREPGPSSYRDRIGLHVSSTIEGVARYGGRYSDSGRLLSSDQLWQVYTRVPDVRACIDSIVRRVATWDYYVEPSVDPSDPRYESALDECEEARRFLAAPNHDGETWQEIWTKVVTDLLVFDAGVIESVFDSRTEILPSGDEVEIPGEELEELVALRGADILPIVDGHGRTIAYKQDLHDTAISSGRPEAIIREAERSRDSQTPTFLPRQIVYLRLFPTTSSVEGQPLIDVLVNEIITMMRQSEHTMLTFDADEIPPGILVLTGLSGAAAEAAASEFRRMRGKDHKVRVLTTPDPTATGARWVELRHTPKDVDHVNVIDQVRRTIWRVFGVLPVEMGATDGMPRAVGQVQLDVSSSHLIGPILEMIEAKVNARILPLVTEGSSLCRFRFDREQKLSTAEQKEKADTLGSLVDRGIVTRNEARSELDLSPVEGGDVLTVSTGQGPIPLGAFVSTPDDGGGRDDGGGSGGPRIDPLGGPSGSPGDDGVGEVAQPDASAPEEGEEAPGEVVASTLRTISEFPEATQKALRRKAEEHNEEVGDDARKRTTPDTLAKVYKRGIGAYKTNPESVRPSVSSPEQWAMARVNSFLYALRNLRFRSGKHDTDLLPESHPMSTKGEEEESKDRAVGDVDPTNFPKAGDDLKVSLRNSEFETFPLDYALALREDYPEIWRAGGNIEGNNQFRRLLPVVERGGVVETETEELGVRKREAWAARHFEDHRLAGVVAQIKWFVVGALGVSGMREVIEEQKRKIDDRAISHSCEAHGSDERGSEERSTLAEDLPSEWQPRGMFSGVRTLDLSPLWETVAGYSRTVEPLYDDTTREVGALFARAYAPGALDDDEAERLSQAVSESLDKLATAWSVATVPRYREATKIGRDAARQFTGLPVVEDSDEVAAQYHAVAMGYLVEPGGLISDLRARLGATISVLTTRARPEPETRAAQTAPKGIDSATDKATVIASVLGIFQAAKHRIKNWAGKLVELSNATTRDGVLEGSTVTDETGEDVRSADWFVEWVSVGDERQCVTCEDLGSRGFVPASSLLTVPGGATECGGRCRCVLVYWTRAEVATGSAVPLSGGS